MAVDKSMMTRLTHAGGSDFVKKVQRGVSVPQVAPIYMSSVFAFDDVASLDAVYEQEADGYVYSRMSNPGIDALCEVLCAAEGSEGALAFSSGMAAIVTTILAHVQAGDHILAHTVLYGGVYTYLKEEISRFGVEVDFLDMLHENVEAHIKPNTRVIYTETISNPLMEVMDLPMLSRIAHAHRCKLIVDNTFATPVIARPLTLGADVSIYSTTKYLGGHSDLIGGAVMASRETIERIRSCQVQYGCIMSPFDAWLLTRSLRTLEVRVLRHSENTQRVAEYLEQHPKIERVYYPGLSSSEYHQKAIEIFRGRHCGGMLSADIAGGAEAACAFIDRCKGIKFVPSLAGVSTTLSYPAKTSHRGYTPEELKRAGISAGQIRFSIGLEDPTDILGEFDRALANL